MLELDPRKRITAAEAINHSFITGNHAAATAVITAYSSNKSKQQQRSSINNPKLSSSTKKNLKISEQKHSFQL